MTVKHTDDAPNECFRKYESSKDSYKDQSDYLKTLHVMHHYSILILLIIKHGHSD